MADYPEDGTILAGSLAIVGEHQYGHEIITLTYDSWVEMKRTGRLPDLLSHQQLIMPEENVMRLQCIRRYRSGIIDLPLHSIKWIMDGMEETTTEWSDSPEADKILGMINKIRKLTPTPKRIS